MWVISPSEDADGTADLIPQNLPVRLSVHQFSSGGVPFVLAARFDSSPEIGQVALNLGDLDGADLKRLGLALVAVADGLPLSALAELNAQSQRDYQRAGSVPALRYAWDEALLDRRIPTDAELAEAAGLADRGVVAQRVRRTIRETVTPWRTSIPVELRTWCEQACT